ncbi:toll/interleukin-1 receptor domain-containing protein [Actinosynnema pretiosum subsp. pretiosum]|uniref:Toll/interleukin-1 receptor domain-containing protein n=1 Tax=Actinosynnema pretiosum subsp. pretiosum TaxID=103721 RepID=A0AA45L916_9PSEU|nr:hypothetical protein APASM_2907 [Actinosynnema pretiosum subsp. pretiosum]QUF05571.1 toll/interleukin-1 receptor domain-containing protein [Actinosynnema pretiosum subsp. pretiosum]
MTGVFVNYRVKDTPYAAAAISALLVERFGAEQVFRDAVSMEPGVRYPEEMRAALRRSDVLVSLVGPRWLEVDEATGRPRIWGERDWVRWEIAEALRLGIAVVPVLLLETPEDARAPRHDQLPDDIRAFAGLQAARVRQRQLARDVAELVNRLVDLAPALVIPRLFQRPADRNGPEEPTPPSAVLLPERGVAPFRGRDRELADLLAWARGTSAGAVRVLTGPPGSGRTRLAGELCRELTAQGWSAGSVDGDAPAEQIRSTGSLRKPLLAVVDDAEVKREQLLALAGVVADRSRRSGLTTRLLLVGPTGGWAEGVRRRPELAELLGGRPDVLAPPLPEREAAVAGAFAAALGLPPPHEVPPEAGGTVLERHVRALALVLGGDGGFAHLHRVDDAWRKDRLAGLGVMGAEADAVVVLGALATLCSPRSTGQAQALLAALPDLMGADRATTDERARLWSLVNPGRWQPAPVRPALLGEHLLVEVLTAHPALLSSAALALPEQLLVSALTELGRALPRHSALRAPAATLLRAIPGQAISLLDPVLEVLPETEPLARVAGDELRRGDWELVDLLDLLPGMAGTDAARQPLRGAALEAGLQAGRRVSDVLRSIVPEAAQPPGTAGLLRGVEKLTEQVLDLGIAFLDPGSGRAPKQPDGTPLVPPDALRLMHELYVRYLQEKREGES